MSLLCSKMKDVCEAIDFSRGRKIIKIIINKNK